MRIRWLFLALPILIFLLGLRSPIFFRWLCGVDGISTVAMSNAQNTTIMDVRTTQEFLQGHLPGASHAPLASLEMYLLRSPLPRDRPLVMVCERGFRSAIAAGMARAHGFQQVASMDGGMLAWRQSGGVVNIGGEVYTGDSTVPILSTSGYEQVTVLLHAFGVKPFYMSLSLIFSLWLWRKKEKDLRLIRWSLLFFFFGELACAIAGLFFHNNDGLEMLHQLGMVVFGALLPLGILEFFDARILHFSEEGKPCVFAKLCRGCWKREAPTCGLHRLMLWVLPAFMLISLLPFTAPIRTLQVNYWVNGTLVPFQLTPTIALMEWRLYPLMASWAFFLAFIFLLQGKRGLVLAKIPFAVGLGFLVFASMRFFLLHAFWNRPFWSDTWEERTELVTLVAIGAFLWIFRTTFGLWPTHTKESPSAIAIQG